MNSEKEEENFNILISDSNEFIKMIFSLEIPEPNPSFSLDFMRIIPDIANSKNINEKLENLQSVFKLDLQSRIPIINYLIIEPPEIQLSDINKEFASKLCLQSYCAIFFTLDDNNCLNYLNDDILVNLFKALSLSFDLIHSNIILIFEFVSIFLDKISLFLNNVNDQSFTKLMQFIGISVAFLSDLPNNDQYQIEIIPICLIRSLIEISTKIIDSLHLISTSNGNKSTLCSLVSDYFIKVQQFITHNKKSIKYSEKLDPFVTTLFQKSSDIAISTGSFVIPLLSFSVEISSISPLKFTQIDLVIKNWFTANSNENLTPTLHFLNESDNPPACQDKITHLKSASSLLCGDSFSSLINFKSKSEICSLFGAADSKLHLLALILGEGSYARQMAGRADLWAAVVLAANDFVANQTDLFNSDYEGAAKDFECVLGSLLPQGYFSMSLFDDEKEEILGLKALSLRAYLKLLKSAKSSKGKSDSCICSMAKPLLGLFEACSIQKIECFYENFLLSSDALRDVYLLGGGSIGESTCVVAAVKKCLKKFLIDEQGQKEIQTEILNVLGGIISSDKYVAYSASCSEACGLFLFLLDNCQDSVIGESLVKLNESYFKKVFDLGAKYSDLVSLDVVSECIESMGIPMQSKTINMLCNSLKSAIFTLTNSSYYNSNSFTGHQSNEYSWSECQSFLKRVFKSRIQRIALDLISKSDNVSPLLDFFSLSSFISSQSSQFTYLAPTVVKVTSSQLGHTHDTFLLMNNSSDSLTSYVDWKAISSELKGVPITREVYATMLQVLSSYTAVTFPIDTDGPAFDDAGAPSLASVFLFGVNSSNVVDLISVIMQTEFVKDFLETLHHLVVGNVIQAMKLFKSNGLLILLDSISGLYENKNFKEDEVTGLIEIILKITVYVITFICSKEVCEKFQKVFYDLNTDRMKNESNFIDSFKSSLAQNPLFTSSFFHFNSTNSLFFLPPIPDNFLDGGVTFVAELLIPSFGEISPSFFTFHNKNGEVSEDELFELPIFYIASENDSSNGYNYLVISLFSNKISFSSNIYESTVFASIEIPQNEWFTLSVSVKKWKQFKVQIIETQKPRHGEDPKKSQQTIKTKEVEANIIGQWSNPIHRIEMFNVSFFSPPDVVRQFKSQRKIEGLIRRVMLFTGGFKFGQQEQRDGRSIVCRNQQLFGHFTPQYCSLAGSRLVNMVTGMEDASIFMINTEPIPLSNEQFVCPFEDFFLKFNGLIEFVLYFSKSGMNEDEMIMLFDTLLFLFERFPFLQKEMYQISGYHLIAHFLNKRQNIEINDRFFNEICKIEESTTHEPLLDQLRNNLIINFGKYLECQNNELLFRILKKWQEYDSSFFRSHVSFSKFCFILYQQFAERKDKIDLSIKKTLMSILVVNSTFLEKQDLYLLTQLTGKLASCNAEASILLIKEIYGITKDHPTKLDTVQRGLIEIGNKPPEILCTIVKLFDTDDEYTKRLLFTEMSERKTPEERGEFVLCFFNSIFNTHQRLSFDELSKLDEFHLVSVNLLLFILSFGFECEESVVSAIVSLFNTIFNKKPETVEFVANSIGMNSITLFIFISFAVFKSHRTLNIVMSLIFSNSSLLADSLRIIGVLSAYCRKDLSEYQSLILNTFVLSVVSPAVVSGKSSGDLSSAVDLVVNFICFGPNRSLFDTTAALDENRAQSKKTVEMEFSLVDFFRAYLEYPIPIDKNEYGLFLNEGGYWSDQKTVEMLLALIGVDGIGEETTRKLLVLFAFLINRHNQIPLQKVSEILDKINTMCGSPFFSYEGTRVVAASDSKSKSVPYFDMLAPVFFSLHQNNYAETVQKSDSQSSHVCIISAFLGSFDVTSELFDKYNSAMDGFVAGLHEISNVSERLLTGLTNESLVKEEKVTIDEAFSDVRQKEITLGIHREKIYRKHRPVLLEKSHYRRYNIFDEYFRPFMLTNKERLKFVQIDSPVFNDNTLGSGESGIKDEAVLWSSPCQRIKVDQTFDGYFSVTNNGYRFITPKGKSYRLLKSSIRYVFWNYCNNEPLSFTVFLLNGKCFLFRFFKPETRESIIEKLSMIELENCHFFQSKKGYEEVGRLKLTQRWRERSISNFDYLMWLNLLSGRTFLDPDYYPVFPLLFASAADQTEMRDLEKSVLFMCQGNVRKWKDVRHTFDPYDNYLLNSAFSTQQVVCTFLNGIEQFKKRETEEAGQVHSQHYFYSAFDDVRGRNKGIDFRSTAEKYSLMINQSASNSQGIKGCKSLSQLGKRKEGEKSALILVNSDMKKLRSFSGLIEGLKTSEVHTELIPEFFFLPEVFNIWQAGKNESPSFPPWAPSASKFILAHICAIESEEVSMNLHTWIDLIWGGRQNDYMYNPALAFASNDKNVQRHLQMVNSDGDGFDGHLPPIFFAGPHPARCALPSFQSSTTVVKVEMKKKKKKKSSQKIDFKPLVNAFFINNSRNNNSQTDSSGSLPRFSIENASRAASSERIEVIDIEAAAQHERSVLQMMRSDTIEPISIGVVSMKKRNVYIVFSNEKVVQLPGNERINLTKQIEESRQNTLGLLQGTQKTNPYLSSAILPDYGDSKSFCFNGTSLYFVPLGSRSLYCFDFSYNKLFTTAVLIGNSKSGASFTAHLYGVTCIDSADNFVVSGSKDTSIIAWSKDPIGISPFKLLLSHKKPIKTLRIVKKMRVLLSLDVGGSLCVSMFPFLRTIKNIDFDFLPELVDMTRCCIIAICGQKVESFTSNGEKIAERTFKNFAIISEVVVDVVSRSDVILIGTTNKEVLLLNCVSLEIVGVLLKLESVAKLMKFDENSGTVAIVTENHEVVFTQIPD